ncbi:MAG: glycoside hydrolase, partial [Chitinophagaceae bacterium]
MNIKRFMVLFGLMGIALVTSAQAKRFYIANDDHTDFVWTANEAVYKDVMLTTLDKYLLQIDSTIKLGLPFNHQAKYNCDGSFWFWLYEKNRTVAQMKNLVDKVTSGHMTVPYNPLAVLYGGLPAEASIRGMYYAGYLQKKYGIPVTLSISMESQVLPLGLSSLWAGSGVKYSWKGVCGCASKMKKSDLQSRDHEVYYYKGLDSQKVLMKWYSLTTKKLPCSRDVNESLGGYAEARCLTNDLVEQLQQKSMTTQKSIIGAFGYGWDDLQTYTAGFVALARTSSNAEHEIIVSNETDYFNDMEATYGKDLPAEVLASGNEWDLYIASLAEVTANIKRSTEKLRAAEALATIVSLQQPDFAKDLVAMRDSAWMSVGLYPEHDWTADGPVKREERAAFQRRLETGYRRYVDTLYERALSLLSSQVKKTSKDKTFFVFNPLNWKRSDYADVLYNGNRDVVVHDAVTKKEVPSQSIIKNARTYLRILATDIPPVGYKAFQIRQGSALRPMPAASFAANTFENSRYKLNLTKEGVIISLIDKIRGNIELVQHSGDGKYLNDMGSGSNDTGDELVIENAGPVSVTLKARSANQLKHTSAITLFHSSIPRVDIQNTIEQNFSSLVSNAFSFKMNKPEIWHEEVGAIINAKTKSEGGHYAERNARYDWLTLNHFASISDGNNSVTLSNKDCYFFKVGSSTHDTLDAGASHINVLVGGQIDGGNLGIKNQGGDSLFHQAFAITTHNNGFDKVQSMKAALEFQQPFV